MEHHNYTIEILTQEAMSKRREQISKVDEQIALRIKTLNGLQSSYEALVHRKMHVERLQLQNDLLRRDLEAIEVEAVSHEKPKKSRANRLNAQRSSGPRTQAGRTIASLNSVKHGLSQPIDPLTSGVNAAALAALLREDGLDALQAHELVMKILDYERNLAHQLRIFQGWQEPGLELTPAVVDAKARERFPEIDMLDEMIQDELFFKGRVSTRDVKKVARIKEAMCRDWIKFHNRQMRAAARHANYAVRYLKRSSNS